MRSAPALFILLLISSTLVLHAQSTNAFLTGRVTDPSKAVIADAKIAAVSSATVSGDGTCAPDPAGARGATATATTASGGSCGAQPVAPVGGVTPRGATTVCCAP